MKSEPKSNVIKRSSTAKNYKIKGEIGSIKPSIDGDCKSVEPIVENPNDLLNEMQMD
jgi:hypothetical protein